MSPNSQVDGPSRQSDISTPFTQSWIQALTLVADNPLARTLKSKLDLVDQLSLNRPGTDRLQAARQLWDLAQPIRLGGLLDLLPVRQPVWQFESDDLFAYQRREFHSESSDPTSFELWCQQLGLAEASYALQAEVVSGDWMGLVRREAVRLQKSFHMGSAPPATTLRLPCTAHWNTSRWSVRFDEVDWIERTYDDVLSVPRPDFSEVQEALLWAVSLANESLIKKAPGCSQVTAGPWTESAARLQPLHAAVLTDRKSFAPWLVRCWCCVWPVIYREQNVLDGRADLDAVRRELKACLDAQPQLVMWMFLYAKLVCQAQLRSGLGHCADFRD